VRLAAHFAAAVDESAIRVDGNQVSAPRPRALPRRCLAIRAARPPPTAPSSSPSILAQVATPPCPPPVARSPQL
jgi:hypothetical protein